MQLPAVPVLEWEDITLNFEALQDLGLYGSSGTGTLTFSASPDSATATIAHGLPTAPTTVVATSRNASAFGEIPILNVGLIDASVFEINGQTTASFTGTVNFSWIAVL